MIVFLVCDVIFFVKSNFPCLDFRICPLIFHAAAAQAFKREGEEEVVPPAEAVTKEDKHKDVEQVTQKAKKLDIKAPVNGTVM